MVPQASPVQKNDNPKAMLSFAAFPDATDHPFAAGTTTNDQLADRLRANRTPVA